MSTSTTEVGKEPILRGFARMTPEKRREFAAKGGRSVAAKDRSFSKNRKLASKAGQTGGRKAKPENRSFSKDRNLAIRAGRAGGLAKKKAP